MNEANLDKGYIRLRELIGDCRSEAFLYVKSSREVPSSFKERGYVKNDRTWL